MTASQSSCAIEARAGARAAGSVAPAEREPILDVLRGVAILGILLVNVEYMRGADLYRVMAGDTLPEPGAVERVLSFGVGWLVAGKFIACFALLFGVGAAMMAARARAHGGSPRGLLARRYLLLAPLGLAHMLLLFPGDILFVYAVTGLLLLAFLRASAGTALRWAAGLLGAVVAATVALARLMRGLAAPAPDDPAAALTGFLQERRDAAVEAFVGGGYGEIVAANAWEAAIIQAGQLVTVPWILAWFLFGFAAGRAGVAADLRAHRRLLRMAAAIGLGLGLPLNVAVGFLGPMAIGAVLSQSGGSLGTAVLGAVGVTLGAPLLAAGYLSVLALVCLRVGPVRPLASVGRVALSAYLLQSLLALVLFAGFDLYDRLTAVEALVVVAGVWTVLLAACPLWLRRFRLGPVEWLWRAATYGRLPPMRRSPVQR